VTAGSGKSGMQRPGELLAAGRGVRCVPNRLSITIAFPRDSSSTRWARSITAVRKTRNCLRIVTADERGLKSVAFPSISTGAFGYPLDEACRIALRTKRKFFGVARRRGNGSSWSRSVIRIAVFTSRHTNRSFHPQRDGSAIFTLELLPRNSCCAKVGTLWGRTPRKRDR
jgi:hypothetical protein